MEYCERCGERPVAVQVTKIINGEKTVARLCRECAEKEGPLPGGAFGQALLGLLGSVGGPQALGGVTVPAKCRNCGRDFAAFAKSSMLGCAQCYDTFMPALLPMLRRMQGSVTHRGMRPQAQADTPAEAPVANDSLQNRLAALRAQLQAAVQSEEYERAAELRDAIRAQEEAQS